MKHHLRQMKRPFAKGAASGLAILAGLAACTAEPDPPQETPFEPTAAWEEFETVLRTSYAYLDRPGKEQAEAQLARSQALASSVETKAAMRALLHKTALTFTDPHLIVGPFTDQDFNIVMTSADLDIALREDAYVVSDVRAGSAADAAGILPGWVLKTVGGEPIGGLAASPYGEVLDEPTEEQLAYGATLVANGRRGDLTRELLFEDQDGREHAVQLASPRVHARNISSSPPVHTDRIEDDARSYAYIRINNSLGDHATIARFDEAVAGHQDADGFIIDLRNTPSGGNTDVARAIIGHFIDRPRPYQMHTMPIVERETSVPRRFVEYAEPRPPLLEGPLVVLHGRWTGSMGEGLVIGLDAAADAHTIGSDMGDLLGGLWNYDLELSGARLDVGAEALFHVDGTPREDYVADQPLTPSDRGINGGDPALDAAIAFLRSEGG